MNTHEVIQVLSYISPKQPHATWFVIASCIKTEFGENDGKQVWLEWNQGGEKPKTEIEGTWRGAKAGYHTAGSIIYLAKQNGYVPKNKKMTPAEREKYNKEKKERENRAELERKQQEIVERNKAETFKQHSATIMDLAIPADKDKTPYLNGKKCTGIGGFNVDLSKLDQGFKNYHYLNHREVPLFLPYYDINGALTAIQVITTASKLPLKGSKFTGSFMILNDYKNIEGYDKIIIGEGYATVEGVYQAVPDACCIVAYSAHNLKVVTGIIRKKNPKAQIILLADHDKSKIVDGKEVGQAGQRACAFASDMFDCDIALPERLGEDWSDVLLKDGVNFIENRFKVFKPKFRYCNSRYVTGAIKEALADGQRLIKVISDMGSGKTYTLGQIIKDDKGNETPVIYLSHLVAIVESTATALTKQSGQRVEFYKDLSEDLGELPYIATTFNSIKRAMSNVRHDLNNAILFIDETEGGADFLANGTIDKKDEATQLLRWLASRVGNIILADAHMGEATDLFIRNKLGLDPREFFTITNTNTPWKDAVYSIADEDEDGVDFVLDFIAENHDKKLAVGCTSATQAEKLHEVLLGAVDKEEIILVSKSTTHNEEAKKAKKHPELFANYKYVVFSPSMGIGVSVKDCGFKDVCMMFSRHEFTGNSKSALQMPFRFRDMRRLYCFNIDHGSESDKELLAKKVKNIESNARRMAKLTDYLAGKAFKDDQEAKEHYVMLAKFYSDYVAEIDKINTIDLDNYYSNIYSTLGKKGMIRVDMPSYKKMDMRQAMKKAKLIVARKKKIAVVEAEEVTDAHKFGMILEKERKDPTALTEAEDNILKRHRLKLLIADEVLHSNDQGEIKSAIVDAYDEKLGGRLGQRNNIILACMPPKDVKRICRAFIAGVDGKYIVDVGQLTPASITAKYSLFSYLAEIFGIKRENMTGEQEESGIIPPKYLIEKGFDGNTINFSASKLRKKIKLYNAIVGRSSADYIAMASLRKDPIRFVKLLGVKFFGLEFDAKRRGSDFYADRQRISKKKEPLLAKLFVELFGTDEKNMMRRKINISSESVQTEFLFLLGGIVWEFNDRKKGKITEKQLQDIPKLIVRLAKLAGIKLSRVSKGSEYTLVEDQKAMIDLDIACSKKDYGVYELNYKILLEEKKVEAKENSPFYNDVKEPVLEPEPSAQQEEVNELNYTHDYSEMDYYPEANYECSEADLGQDLSAYAEYFEGANYE